MIATMSDIPLMIHFSKLPDPRKKRNQRYLLSDLIATAIMAVLSGADDFPTICFWTEENLPWLQSLQICENGVPSHDTYYKLFRSLNSKVFEERFIEWTRHIADKIPNVIAIDGKSVNAARDGLYAPIHLVSAFCVENQLVFGSTQAEGGIKGELNGIKALLQILDVKGMTVTIDAGGCYRVIAEAIQANGGDYVFTVKKNQRYLFDELEKFFLDKRSDLEKSDESYWYSEEKGHGRLEKRQVWTCGDLKSLSQKDKWPGLQSIVCIKRVRKNLSTGKVSETFRYYISSHESNAEKHSRIVRSHWAIENNLHWQLDVSFNEDRVRVRRDNGGYNLALLRKLCLSLFKKENSVKAGVKNKRHKAGWSKDYLLKVLQSA